MDSLDPVPPVNREQPDRPPVPARRRRQGDGERVVQVAEFALQIRNLNAEEILRVPRPQ